MNIALWIAAGVLAAAFLAAGLMKITGKREQMIERMPWVADFPQGQIKASGAIEVLGALGLILPAVTGIAPILVPLAATGLAITMVLAAIMHLRRGDGFGAVVPNIVLFALAVFCQSAFQAQEHATIQQLAGDVDVGAATGTYNGTSLLVGGVVGSMVPGAIVAATGSFDLALSAIAVAALAAALLAALLAWRMREGRVR